MRSRELTRQPLTASAAGVLDPAIDLAIDPAIDPVLDPILDLGLDLTLVTPVCVTMPVCLTT